MRAIIRPLIASPRSLRARSAPIPHATIPTYQRAEYLILSGNCRTVFVRHVRLHTRYRQEHEPRRPRNHATNRESSPLVRSQSVRSWPAASLSTILYPVLSCPVLVLVVRYTILTNQILFIISTTRRKKTIDKFNKRTTSKEFLAHAGVDCRVLLGSFATVVKD